MSDPTTLHPPGLDARVLVKIGLAIIACLAAVLGVAVAAIFGQIGNARVEVGSVWTGLSAINDRLAELKKPSTRRAPHWTNFLGMNNGMNNGRFR
jgi:hypothetical protein